MAHHKSIRLGKKINKKDKVDINKINFDYNISQRGKEKQILDSFFPDVIYQENHKIFNQKIFEEIQKLNLQQFLEITFVELEHHSKKLIPYSAPGWDGYQNIFIKNCILEISDLLTILYNNIIKLGIHPDLWKEHVIIPIPKSKQNHKDTKNWRPISLLSVFSKFLEMIITFRILKYYEENKFFVFSQFGFRDGKGVLFSLQQIHDRILNIFHQKLDAFQISFDISKAFDRLWHEKLIFFLLKQNAPVYIIKWLYSFLKDRILQLNSKQYWKKLSRGVPQGSPISPVIFLIFINDLITILQDQGFNFSFADDVNQIFKFQIQNLYSLQISDFLRKIFLWSEDNLMEFNALKTQVCIFFEKRKSEIIEFQKIFLIFFNGEYIQPKLECKILGLTFQYNLKWEVHVNKKLNEAKVKFQKLQEKFRGFSTKHSRIKKNVINSLIFTSLFYGLEIQGYRASSDLRQEIDSFIGQCSRAVFCFNRQTNYNVSKFLVGFKPFECFLMEKQLSFGSFLKFKANKEIVFEGELFKQVERKVQKLKIDDFVPSFSKYEFQFFKNFNFSNDIKKCQIFYVQEGKKKIFGVFFDEVLIYYKFFDCFLTQQNFLQLIQYLTQKSIQNGVKQEEIQFINFPDSILQRLSSFVAGCFEYQILKFFQNEQIFWSDKTILNFEFLQQEIIQSATQVSDFKFLTGPKEFKEKSREQIFQIWDQGFIRQGNENFFRISQWMNSSIFKKFLVKMPFLWNKVLIQVLSQKFQINFDTNGWVNDVNNYISNIPCKFCGQTQQGLDEHYREGCNHFYVKKVRSFSKFSKEINILNVGDLKIFLIFYLCLFYFDNNITRELGEIFYSYQNLTFKEDFNYMVLFLQVEEQVNKFFDKQGIG
eukprot:TRINITY_DN6404_c0_g2_i5.p1 TRINITY_DN6404_c0_g2~~TRINITY_DN6404_c0_g2_i5.p1  ORF type:complete len:887 (-),score=40.16 TRINITY_DN6404_c0_g2_i5:46-2676(-)